MLRKLESRFESTNQGGVDIIPFFNLRVPKSFAFKHWGD